MDNQPISESVTDVQLGNRKVWLIGTAHISKKSIDEVEQVISSVKPGRVCVEIDASRYKAVSEGQNWQNLNIAQVIRQRKGFLLLANLVLSSFQRRMGEELGIKQGAEMLKAIEASEDLGIPYSFADREVQVTLRRAWGKSNFWNKMKLLASLLGSAFSREKLTEEQLEELKQKSALEDMLGELAKMLPSIKEVLIDERDRYLATKIYQTSEERVVAVVGAGHVPGIVQWLKRLESGEAGTDLSDIDSASPPSKVGKIIPWVIPAAIAGLLIAGFFRSGWREALSMFWMWVLVNGTLSAAGALAALAHPLTIVISFAAAPITSMNPTIGVGIVTGLIEALLRKPQVGDFENLHDDIKSFRGFYRNRLTHILLVFFFSTIGSAIGTFIGIPYLSSLLFK
jgi:pheromone shutdown-related protein TraB